MHESMSDFLNQLVQKQINSETKQVTAYTIEPLIHSLNQFVKQKNN